MSKNVKINKVIKEEPATAQPANPGWIPMRSGLIIITIASLMMAGLTAWELIPATGVALGILYGLLFGVLLWVVFLVSQVVFRWLKKV